MLFIAALTVALLPTGPPPAGLAVWAAVVVTGFILSAADAVASQARTQRVVRTVLRYWALVAAAVLGILAAFRAAGAPTHFLPTTSAGWWAAGFLAAFLALGFSPWAVLTPATVMAGPALALAAIVSYRDRSELSAVALVAAPAQLAFFDLAVLITLAITPRSASGRWSQELQPPLEPWTSSTEICVRGE